MYLKQELNQSLGLQKKNAYGRHQISWLMPMEASIYFLLKKINKKNNPLRVGPQMHQSTSQTPPTHGPSTGKIWNNSSFLRVYESVDKCTSPLVKNLPRVDAGMQFVTDARILSV